MTDSTNERDSIVTGLRELADFLEANPALNHPGLGNFSAQISHLNPTFNERSAAVDADAAVMGVTATNPTGYGNYVAKRMFGRRVELRSVAIRPGVIKGLDLEPATPEPAPAEPTPAEMDRRTLDSAVVGDPVPDDLDPGVHTLNQCRVHSLATAAGSHRCDRSDTKHVTGGGGQHLAVGPLPSGEMVVTAVWPAGTGWASA